MWTIWCYMDEWIQNRYMVYILYKKRILYYNTYHPNNQTSLSLSPCESQTLILIRRDMTFHVFSKVSFSFSISFFFFFIPNIQHTLASSSSDLCSSIIHPLGYPCIDYKVNMLMCQYYQTLPIVNCFIMLLIQL